MDKLQVPNEFSGNRVRERADALLASCIMREHREVGTEELIRLGDRYGDSEPVPGVIESAIRDVVLAQPSIYCRSGLRSRS